MKTFFSEFHFNRERYAGFNPPDFYTVLNDIVTKLGDGIPNGERKQSQIFMLASEAFGEMRMLSGRGIDYFIESEALAGLIAGMVGKFTPAVLNVFSEHREEVFVIHCPSPRPAILCVISNSERTGTNIYMAEERTSDYKNALNSNTCLIGNKSFAENTERQPRNEYERLIVGLALYMRFFPAAVRDGIPDCAKHPNHYRKSRCASIKLTEELVNRSGPKPHIRRAHFRFCSSPYFKDSLNKYILVRESFVKGRCRIVVEAEGRAES
jgi:hypothetical protein